MARYVAVVATITVLGSANMDLVAVVDRMPEPGETVAGRRFVRGPGGKGANQALAAARSAGGPTKVQMLGAVGSDAFGAEIRAVLEESGVGTSGLDTAAEPTGTAHITVDAQGENAIVVIPGANGTVSRLTEQHQMAIAGSDLLLLQFELPLNTVEQAAAWARAHQTSVLLTPAPVQALSPVLLQNVDYCICNESEALQLSGGADVVAAAEQLVERGIRGVVVTRGSRGCLYVAGNGTRLDLAAPQVTAVDTTGAGDCFVGAFAAALSMGEPVASALRWAVGAAALSVQRSGAADSLPLREQIEAFLAEWTDTAVPRDG